MTQIIFHQEDFCGCGLAISDGEAKSTDGLASGPNQQLYHFSAYRAAYW